MPEQLLLMVIAAMGAIIMLLLGLQVKRMGSLESKVDDIGVAFNRHLIDSANTYGQYLKKDDCKDCPPLEGLAERLGIVHRARELAWKAQDKVNDDLWHELNTHSHESLPPNARVIRGST